MAGELPPIPYKSTVLTPKGRLTEPWAKFIRQLFVRVGGLAANPTEGSDSTGNLSLDVTNLQNRIQDLQQGRNIL